MTFPEIVECAFEDGPRRIRWLAPWGKYAKELVPASHMGRARNSNAHFNSFCSRALTNFFILIYQVGSSAIYVVFMASNFKQVR